MYKKVITRLLGQAYEEESADRLLFLPTKTDLSDAPKKRQDDEVNEHSGSSVPVSESYRSPFVGKTIEDVAFILRDASEDVDLDRRLFAVIDAKSGSKDTITVCRRGNADYEGDDVEWYRIDATEAAMELDAIEPGTWEQHKRDYDRNYRD